MRSAAPALARWSWLGGTLAGVLVGLLAACPEPDGRAPPAPRTLPARGAGGPTAGEPGAKTSLAPDGLVARMPSVFGAALVFDDGPWRCIAINRRTSIQSCTHRTRALHFRYEYVQLLLTGALAAESPKRGVLLGLGGAGIAHLLRVARPELKLDVVEIDGAVVTLAGRYFGYSPRAGEQALVEDAAKFVTRPERAGRHDLVLVDCFGESFIPPALLTEPFFKAVRGLLAPKGVLVANLWSTHARYEGILKQYARLYPSVWLLPGGTSGNSIVIASRGALADRATLFARARALDARGQLPFRVAPHVLRIRRP